MFEIAATNLKKAHSKRDPITPQLPTKLKEGDRVLIKIVQLVLLTPNM